MTDRFAPEGAIWVCGACGKTSDYDSYGIEGRHDRGWDESCALNAILVHKDKHVSPRGLITWVPFDQPLPSYATPSINQQER